jgi:Flp pilus assembly protein TadG
MVLMLAGTMDFGRIFYTATSITSAARAGVQYASFTAGNAGNFDAIKQAAQNEAANQGLAAQAITVTAKTFCQCVGNTSTTLTYNSCSVTSCSAYGQTGPPPSYSEVTVSYTFTTLMNWPSIPSSTTITRVARMRVQ